MHLLILLFLSTSSFATTLTEKINTCGRYRLNGEVHCLNKKCEFILFKKSQSEYRFNIEERVLLYRKLHKKYAEADFTVESIDPLKIRSDGPPQSALPVGGDINATIKLIEGGKCK